MKTLKDLNVENKKVLLRCDFNVPIKDGKIEDDTRIVASLKTIKYIMEKNAKLIIFSHLGRVKEEADLEKNNLLPVAKRLGELLGKEIIFSETTKGKELEEKIDNMNFGDILLVQNTRFEDLDGKKESGNDPELASYWASLGDCFVNDAFGTLHRAHASNVGIASNMIGKSCFGFLVEEELTALQVLDEPERPFMVVLGGAKVEDKIGVINNLITKSENVLIGGAMCFTFLKANGIDVGSSIVSEENIEYAKGLLNKYSSKIVLPVDVVTQNGVKDIDKLDKKDIGFDLGPKTIKLFEEKLDNASLVLWNGPLGKYEDKEYEKCTKEIMKYLSKKSYKSILAGGDVVSASNYFNIPLTYSSTGGGATLEYLSGKKFKTLGRLKG